MHPIVSTIAGWIALVGAGATVALLIVRTRLRVVGRRDDGEDPVLAMLEQEKLRLDRRIAEADARLACIVDLRAERARLRDIAAATRPVVPREVRTIRDQVARMRLDAFLRAGETGYAAGARMLDEDFARMRRDAALNHDLVNLREYNAAHTRADRLRAALDAIVASRYQHSSAEPVDVVRIATEAVVDDIESAPTGGWIDASLRLPRIEPGRARCVQVHDRMYGTQTAEVGVGEDNEVRWRLFSHLGCEVRTREDVDWWRELVAKPPAKQRR